MTRAAPQRGWIDAARAMREADVSIERGGTDRILSLAAADRAERHLD